MQKIGRSVLAMSLFLVLVLAALVAVKIAPVAGALSMKACQLITPRVEITSS